LEASELDVPKIRPAVLGTDAIKVLDPYLSFRHRFRNHHCSTSTLISQDRCC